MFRYLRKNKVIFALAAVILGCFIWMTSQVRQPGSASLPEQALSSAAYPVVFALDWISDSAAGVWKGYFWLVGTGDENKRLKAENAKLKLENIQLREEAARLKRFSELLSLGQDSPWPTIGARAVGRDSSSWFKTVWINRGESDGIRKDMPATVYTGVVGKVVRTYRGTSRVQLLTDIGSSVSCFTERTREPGLITGDGAGGCSMNFVGKHADVKDGDLVITSGMDGIFPAGLPVGVVEAVSRNSPGYFLEIDIKPTADINRLEELAVLQYEPPIRPIVEMEAEKSAEGTSGQEQRAR